MYLSSPAQPPHSHLESYPGGVGGADQSLDQVVLRLGLHLGQGPALGDTELECGQPVGGTREELETLGGGHRPAGGAGGGGDALEGVGGPAGDGGAGEEREETAGQSALGGTSISVSQSSPTPGHTHRRVLCRDIYSVCPPEDNTRSGSASPSSTSSD